MKMLSILLGVFLSSQIVNASTLVCAISSESSQGVNHVKMILKDGVANLQLGSVFGYKVEASGLALGNQSVVIASKDGVRISSTSAGGMVNLRLESADEIKEYFSHEDRTSEQAMGFNIDFYNLGQQSTIIASKRDLRISCASAGKNVSNLRLESESGVYEVICKVTK